MTGVLKILERRGLVERTPHRWHRNVLETRLTDAGRAALRVADERAVAIERRVAEAFTSGERETLRALLDRFVGAVRDGGASTE